ncbi:MAG: hypothetical protein ACOX2L_05975 [Anaerolineae bacterium]|jgi:hypothetical protein|nr:hypothetical protein [Chloroflexota bacterium]
MNEECGERSIAETFAARVAHLVESKDFDILDPAQWPDGMKAEYLPKKGWRDSYFHSWRDERAAILEDALFQAAKLEYATFHVVVMTLTERLAPGSVEWLLLDQLLTSTYQLLLAVARHAQVIVPLMDARLPRDMDAMIDQIAAQAVDADREAQKALAESNK